MRQFILLGILTLLSLNYVQAQINAITETGDEVILYPDGTWKYFNDSVITNTKIKVNEKEFMKDKSSTFIVKSKKFNIGIWMNPKVWSFTKSLSNEAAEFQFQKKGEDLYAMLITEKMEIPIEALKGIAIENAKGVAPDITIENEEYRTVNGIQVLMLQMSGTIQGMRVSYIGYYYSNSNGTLQLITYTGENLLNDYKEDIELFLNGLVELQ